MNEIIQNLKANKTDGYTNFCEISEEMLNAIKELSRREYEENKKYKEVINKLNNYVYDGYLINTKDIKDILKEVEHD